MIKIRMVLNYISRDTFILRNVKILTDAKIQEMDSEGLIVEHDGKAEEVKAESIVLAMGVKAERRLYEELKDQENVLIIGGDKAPANALTAVRLGYEAGLHA